LLLRLAARGGDRRAGACSRVSLHGVPAPYLARPFGVSTYFPKEQVRTEGPNKVYDRGSDSGRKVEFHFCADCGSTVFWYADFGPDLIGIAFGAFADPSMPRPTLSAWETTGHSWVTFDHELDHLGRQDELIEAPGTTRG
jgi:hypothetical protein